MADQLGHALPMTRAFLDQRMARWAAEPPDHRARRKEIVSSPATAFWVKEMIPKLEDKDPLDVVHGLSGLLDLFVRRADEALGLVPPRPPTHGPANGPAADDDATPEPAQP